MLLNPLPRLPAEVADDSLLDDDFPFMLIADDAELHAAYVGPCLTSEETGSVEWPLPPVASW